MEHFADRLLAAVKCVGNPVLAGIDPRVDWLPDAVRTRFPRSVSGAGKALTTFCSEVFDVLAQRVAAVKLQSAYFERMDQGIFILATVAHEAKRRGFLVIHDGKRNDIGPTAEAYAAAYLERADDPLTDEPRRWPFDAMTVNPYLGSDGITPFLLAASRTGNGLFVLVRTSNPSAREFQDLVCDGVPVYRHVADRLRLWAAPFLSDSGYSLAGAVVGATYPQELAELRAALPGVIFLVPGYGAQGGTAKDVAAAFDENGLGAIVNNSRGLVFAFREAKYGVRAGSNWQRAIELALEDMIADLAENTPAGRLRPGG